MTQVRVGEKGQLTGLFDKKGREVAIGDTLSFDGRVWHSRPGAPNHKFVVEWDKDECALVIGGSAHDVPEYCTVVKGWDEK